MFYDTLEYDGIERRLDKWGISKDGNVTKIRNLAADTHTLHIAATNITDDPIFPYEAFIIMRKGRASATGNDNSFNPASGATIFQGKRIANPLRANGSGTGVSFQFQGPWYDLDITNYTQTFKGATANFNPGEVVLHTAAAPAISTAGLRLISVGDQIQSILQCVLDGYAAQGLPAPFQYVGRDLNAGAIDLNVSSIGTGVVNQNTDKTGAPYTHLVNAGTTIDVALFKFFLQSEIIRPVTAAQCLQKFLDASPRTNITFDYSTTPPTIHIKNIDNLPAVNLPLFDGTTHTSIDLHRRDDLIPSAVIIGYRITDSVGGGSVVNYKEDKWGPHGSNSASDPSTGPGVIIQTLDLQGFSETFTSAFLDCEPLACIGGTHAQRRGWWAGQRGGEMAKLKDYRVRFQDESGAATTIPNAKIYYCTAGFDSTGAAVAAGQEFTAADYAFFTYRLFRGPIHSWMKLVDETPVKSVKVKITAADVKFAQFDNVGSGETDTVGNNPHRFNEDLHMGSIELTNGVTGPYSTIASTTAGESYILGAGGIAQYLWNMLSVPQYEGDWVKVEASFTGGVSLLNRVNFTGGRAEWAVMNAQVQEIECDWNENTTRVKIGIAKHLSAGQLSAFLNMWAQRRSWYNPALKADNTVSSGGEVDMPTTVGNANTVPGLVNPGQTTNTLYTTPPSGVTPGVVAAQLNHDPNKIKAALDAAGAITLADPAIPAHIMEPKEVGVCTIDGEFQFMLVHAGGAYTKP